MFGTSFPASDVELEVVSLLVKKDMQEGLRTLAGVTTENISAGVPPPKGAWLSCCFLAKGFMHKTPAFSPVSVATNGILEVKFGMRDVKPSSAYHWAHEAGSPQGVRAKRYFQKGVTKSKAAVKRNPNRFFKRA